VTQTEKRATPLGLTASDALALRIREVRKRRGWSVQQLAERCASLGAPELTRAVLANIESGRPDTRGQRRRTVSVDELLALALALDTAPVFLLALPDEREPDTALVLTSTHAEANADLLQRWLRGDEPLPGANERFYAAMTLEHLPSPDTAGTVATYARTVLQDRTAELLGQFRAEAARLHRQAQQSVETLIQDAEQALAQGATPDDVLALLRAAHHNPE